MTFVLDNMADSEATSGGSDDTPLSVANSQANNPGRDWRLYNVILLGFSFMLIFTAFMTCSMAEVGLHKDMICRGSRGGYP